MGRGPTQGNETVVHGKGSLGVKGSAEGWIILCCPSIPWCSENKCLVHNIHEMMLPYRHPIEPQGSFMQMCLVDQCRVLHLHHICVLPVPCSPEAKVYIPACWLSLCGISCLPTLPSLPLSFLCVLVGSRDVPWNYHFDFRSSSTKSVLINSWGKIVVNKQKGFYRIYQLSSWFEGFYLSGMPLKNFILSFFLSVF